MLYLFWLIYQTKTTCKHCILSELQPNFMGPIAVGMSILLVWGVFLQSQKVIHWGVWPGHFCKQQTPCVSGWPMPASMGKYAKAVGERWWMGRIGARPQKWGKGRSGQGRGVQEERYPPNPQPCSWGCPQPRTMWTCASNRAVTNLNKLRVQS